MPSDWARIKLATRLQTMNKVLDRIVLDPPSDAAKGAIKIMVGAVAQGEPSVALTVLENSLEANPFWLRGYLLLATIYQYLQNAEQAMATMERGLAICASGLRLFQAQGWIDAVERINGPIVHNRIQKNAERLRRYERMFAQRLAMLQIRCGSFDEAIEQWSITDEEHCV